MPRLSEAILHAFRDELRKEAGFGSAIASAAPRLKSMGALGGAGALAGGALGTGIGAVHDYNKAREEGAGVGGAALQGLSGGVSGGLRGAGIGALAGAGAGAITKMDPTRLVARNDALGSAARFGQRQVHAVTGMLEPAELEGIRGGAYAARERMKAQFGGDKATKAFNAASEAQNMKLTSLPGYLGAMREHGAGKVLSTGLKDQYHSIGPGMTALMVGAPALGAAHTLATKESPTGPGKGERLGHELGGMVGGVAGGAMPLVGNVAVGELGGRAGATVGRVIDRIRGRRPPIDELGQRAPLEPTESQNTPTERITSPSAAGQQKDVGL